MASASLYISDAESNSVIHSYVTRLNAFEENPRVEEMLSPTEVKEELLDKVLTPVEVKLRARRFRRGLSVEVSPRARRFHQDLSLVRSRLGKVSPWQESRDTSLSVSRNSNIVVEEGAAKEGAEKVVP
ncbi:unnamed protein product [Arabis nemorensis]|uniref:Uncharacterized protein n=1 Tax=Arabis nemorensis TaxID=586526 RepID=A0A565C555_9BRAS|nr:unnamed protein product [Arabis nemorensis]